jgi:hypothetical protein
LKIDGQLLFKRRHNSLTAPTFHTGKVKVIVLSNPQSSVVALHPGGGSNAVRSHRESLTIPPVSIILEL